MKTELKTSPKTVAKKSAAKAAPKAARNTPAKKQETKAAPKAHTFALVAGIAVQITHKGLKQAVKYHTAKGSLKLTDKGVELTPQGASLWGVERVAKDPAKFQEFALWMKGAGPVPKDFATQPATEAAPGVPFPNMLYWGSFATLNMRQVFAALWAK